MSLINQMLRDLEQRNTEKPNTGQELKVTVSANRRVNWLWVLPLIALPSTYLWLKNPIKQADHQIAVTNTPAVNVDLKPSPVINAGPQIPELEPTPAPISMPTANNTVMAVTEKSISTQENVYPIPKPVAKRLTVKPEKKPEASAQKQAETLYSQAKASTSNLMTKEILYETLRIEPLYLPARTLLLQTLVKSHASDQEIIRFTENSLQLFPENLLFIKTRAHLYIQQKNFAAGVNLLEKIDPENIEDSHYLSLLAAGYHQLQRFSQSARIYQQLARIQPDKAENWLGLAIARDKLNQADPAMQAYRQALDKKTLSSEVVDYIKQRLSALN